jgi:hypothetical protein
MQQPFAGMHTSLYTCPVTASHDISCVHVSFKTETHLSSCTIQIPLYLTQYRESNSKQNPYISNVISTPHIFSCSMFTGMPTEMPLESLHHVINLESWSQTLNWWAVICTTQCAFWLIMTSQRLLHAMKSCNVRYESNMTFHFEALSFELQVERYPAHKWYSYRPKAESLFRRWL